MMSPIELFSICLYTTSKVPKVYPYKDNLNVITVKKKQRTMKKVKCALIFEAKEL